MFLFSSYSTHAIALHQHGFTSVSFLIYGYFCHLLLSLFDAKADFLKIEVEIGLFYFYSLPLPLFPCFHWSLIQCIWSIWMHIVQSLTVWLPCFISTHPFLLVHYWCQSAICPVLFFCTVSFSYPCTSLPICTIILIVFEYTLIVPLNICHCRFFYSIPSFTLFYVQFFSEFNQLKFIAVIFFFL